MLINPELKEHYKLNKEQITQELLETLRKTNEGKQLCIELLDLEQDEELYYLDAYKNRISFNGNRQLKKSFTKLPLSSIHVQEIEKCSKDLEYFRNNYVKIKTPKGINFPDLRPYQDRFLKEINTNKESFVVLFPRQSGKSITTAIYLTWLFIFKTDINIGICANKGAMAREFLNNVKNIFLSLPIWLQQGIKVWNKGSIEGENGMRILTDVPSGDAFRGFTCLDGKTFINVYDKEDNTKKELTLEHLYNEMQKLKNNTKYLIETPSGFKPFKSVKKSNETKGLEILFADKSTIRCTPNHLIKNNGKFIKAASLKENDLITTLNKGKCVKKIQKITKIKSTFYDPYEVSGHEYIAAGLIHHNCGVLVVDECAYIPTTRWQEFIDGIMPSQSSLAWKKNILLSTANGMNHFYQIVKGAKQNKVLLDLSKDQLSNIKDIKETRQNEDGTYDVVLNSSSNGYNLIEVDWKEVPRYDSKGNIKEPSIFKQEIVDKYGLTYFNQAFANHFIGSSYTLISGDCLEQLQSSEEQSLKDNMLKIFIQPKKGHKYILSVDPSKDGLDYFSVNVLDITKFPFVQVASAKLKVDYFKMPDFLNEWGKLYNTAFMIIENNEGSGQSIADILWRDYEYENLYFDKSLTGSSKKKSFPGFRTTVKTRKLILDTLKLFIENGNLKLNDKTTIDEFYTFVLINNKYQAEDGYHDDMIMSLALCFAPFCHLKNFNEMKQLIKNFYSDTKNETIFTDFMTIGFFDC